MHYLLLPSKTNLIETHEFTLFGSINSNIEKYAKVLKYDAIEARYIMWKFDVRITQF